MFWNGKQVTLPRIKGTFGRGLVLPRSPSSKQFTVKTLAFCPRTYGTSSNPISSTMTTSVSASFLIKTKGQSRVLSVPPTTTVKEAAVLMVKHNIGSLLVQDLLTSKVMGIITERDFLRASMQDLSSDSTQVVDFMTPSDKLISVTGEETISHCMELMSKYDIRHLPVFDAEGNPKGMLSIKDVVKFMLYDTNSQLERVTKFVDQWIKNRAQKIRS